MPAKWRRGPIPQVEELNLPFSVFANYEIRVIVADDIEKAAWYITDRDYLRDPGNTTDSAAFTINSPAGGYSLVFIRPDSGVGTIAHESYHAVCGMLDMIGANEEHEIVAYHLGFVVDAIIEFQMKVARRFKCKTKKHGNSSKLLRTSAKASSSSNRQSTS
jgi:hypothetical protein